MFDDETKFGQIYVMHPKNHDTPCMQCTLRTAIPLLLRKSGKGKRREIRGNKWLKDVSRIVNYAFNNLHEHSWHVLLTGSQYFKQLD